MTKLELTAKLLQQELCVPDLTKDQMTEILSAALRTFAGDAVNLNNSLREKNIDVEACNDLLEEFGLKYNGKSKKFS